MVSVSWNRVKVSARSRRAAVVVGASAALMAGTMAAAVPAQATEAPAPDTAAEVVVSEGGTVSPQAGSSVKWSMTSHPDERTPVTVTYSTTGFAAGNRVWLQRKVRGVWKDVTSARTAAGSMRFTAPTQGQYTYRLLLKGGRTGQSVKAVGQQLNLYSYRKIPFYEVRGWAEKRLVQGYKYDIYEFYGSFNGSAECKSLQFTATNFRDYSTQTVVIGSSRGPRVSVAIGPGGTRRVAARVSGPWQLFVGDDRLMLNGSATCWKKPTLS